MKERITLQRDLIAPASFSIKNTEKKGDLFFPQKDTPQKRWHFFFASRRNVTLKNGGSGGGGAKKREASRSDSRRR